MIWRTPIAPWCVLNLNTNFLNTYSTCLSVIVSVLISEVSSSTLPGLYWTSLVLSTPKDDALRLRGLCVELRMPELLEELDLSYWDQEAWKRKWQQKWYFDMERWGWRNEGMDSEWNEEKRKRLQGGRRRHLWLLQLSPLSTKFLCFYLLSSFSSLRCRWCKLI